MENEDDFLTVDDIDDEEDIPLVLAHISEALLKQTKNLVKSTNKLKCWTIGIAVATVLLLAAAIIQIVSSMQLLNAVGALAQ